MNVLEKYDKKKIYECVLKTVNISGFTKDQVIEELESLIPGVVSIVNEYESAMALHPSRRLRGLSGPHVMTFFPNIMGKRILLLGERHANDTICDNSILSKDGVFEVHKWLSALSQNAPSCIDLFTEISYKKLQEKPYFQGADKYSNLKDTSSGLESIMREFMVLKNKGVSLLQLRHHTMDVRQIENYHAITTLYFHVMRKNKKANELEKDSAIVNKINAKYRNVKRPILMYLLGWDTPSGKMEYYKYINELYDTFSVDRPDIDKFQEAYFRIIQKELSKMDKSIEMNRFMETLLTVYLKTVDLWTAILNAPMDIYCLSRIFIQFNEAKMSRGPGGCKNPKTQNVIVYTGANHTRVYETFLKSYFNVDPTISLKSQVQCMEFPEFDFFG